MISKNEIKYIQSLHSKKFRDEHNKFIAEGIKLITDLLNDAPNWIDKLYVTENFVSKQPEILIGKAFELIDDIAMQRISLLDHPSPMLAIVNKPIQNINNNFKNNWALALSNLQDPGNMGTIIRTADWFGINHIIASENTVECYNPKVVQSSMGSIFRVQINYVNLKNYFETNKLPVYGAYLQGKSVFELKNIEKGIIIIGNEGKGIDDDLEKYVTQKIVIPKHGNAESLNAAIAAGIIMAQLIN